MRLWIERDGVAVIIHTHTEGPPIPPQALPHLFDPFYRASATGQADEPPASPRRPPQRRGLGLGLYIARHIAEGHEGALSVTSSQGRGTTFSVRLPRHGSARAAV